MSSNPDEAPSRRPAVALRATGGARQIAKRERDRLCPQDERQPALLSASSSTPIRMVPPRTSTSGLLSERTVSRSDPRVGL